MHFDSTLFPKWFIYGFWTAVLPWSSPSLWYATNDVVSFSKPRPNSFEWDKQLVFQNFHPWKIARKGGIAWEVPSAMCLGLLYAYLIYWTYMSPSFSSSATHSSNHATNVGVYISICQPPFGWLCVFRSFLIPRYKHDFGRTFSQIVANRQIMFMAACRMPQLRSQEKLRDCLDVNCCKPASGDWMHELGL